MQQAGKNCTWCMWNNIGYGFSQKFCPDCPVRKQKPVEPPTGSGGNGKFELKSHDGSIRIKPKGNEIDISVNISIKEVFDFVSTVIFLENDYAIPAYSGELGKKHFLGHKYSIVANTENDIHLTLLAFGAVEKTITIRGGNYIDILLIGYRNDDTPIFALSGCGCSQNGGSGGGGNGEGEGEGGGDNDGDENNEWELYYIKSDDDVAVSTRFIIPLINFDGWSPDKAEFFTEQKMYFDDPSLIELWACQPKDGIKLSWDENTATKVPFDGLNEAPLVGGNCIKQWGLWEDSQSIWIGFSTAGYPIPIKIVIK
jgi:hypothetical protein